MSETGQGQSPTAPISEHVITQHSSEPRWIIVKRVNGHFEPISGNIIQSFADKDEAIGHRNALAGKYRGQTFAIFGLVGQSTLQPVMVVDEVSATVSPIDTDNGS